MNQPYHNYHQFLEDRYGHQLFRIPIDLGFGCPNRNPDGSGGCTFCPESGARAQQTCQSETIADQVRDAIEFSRRRYRARHFMAYFQAFTSTFAPASQQREIYESILDLFEFEAVAIGTRPDCLPDGTLDYLCELNERTEVWVELGVQTCHDETLRRINRGHDWASSETAIRRLHERGMKVAAHVILGLPGESEEDFIQTAQKLGQLPIDGVKIHNLHIVKETELAREYETCPFRLLNEYEYLDALIEFLRWIPSRVPIIRVQTDTPDDELVAPRWEMDKGQFLELLSQHMRWRCVCQGDQLEAAPEPESERRAIETDDGSITFWSSEFKEHYHTPRGAHAEAIHKYIEPSGLHQLLTKKPVRLLDVCFGLGYNTLAACRLAMELGGRLEVIALEIDRGMVRDAAATVEDPFAKEILNALFADGEFSNANCNIQIIWGDARHTLSKLAAEYPFDLVYYDGFSTQKNSELWTVEIFAKVRRLMTGRAKLLTYCAALPARAGMIAAGLCVGNTPAFGRERSGTIAAIHPDDIAIPIDQQEMENLETSTKGIPFRDPHAVWSNREILKRRELEVARFKANQ